jgi:hypothetical protein
MCYAMVVVVEAPDEDAAYDSVAMSSLPDEVQFVGSPWEVQSLDGDLPEFDTVEAMKDFAG